MLPAEFGRSDHEGFLVILEFPPDHELLGFFESEPTVLTPSDPWLYNTLEFTTVRSNITVRCRLVPSYGEITTRFIVDGCGQVRFALRDAEAIRIRLLSVDIDAGPPRGQIDRHGTVHKTLKSAELGALSPQSENLHAEDAPQGGPAPKDLRRVRATVRLAEEVEKGLG